MKPIHLIASLVVSVLGAFLIAMLIIIPTLNPPEKDIQLLFCVHVGYGHGHESAGLCCLSA